MPIFSIRSITSDGTYHLRGLPVGGGSLNGVRACTLPFNHHRPASRARPYGRAFCTKTILALDPQSQEQEVHFCTWDPCLRCPTFFHERRLSSCAAQLTNAKPTGIT